MNLIRQVGHSVAIFFLKLRVYLLARDIGESNFHYILPIILFVLLISQG